MRDELGFTLDSITRTLSIRIDPERHTCQGQKYCAERLQEVEA